MSENKNYLIWRRLGYVSSILLLLVVSFVFFIAFPIIFDIPHKVEFYPSSNESKPLVAMSVPRHYKVHRDDAHNLISVDGVFCSGFDDMNDTFIEMRYSLYGERNDSIYDVDGFLSQLNYRPTTTLGDPDVKQITYTNLGSVIVGNTSFNKIILTYPELLTPPTYYVKFYDTGYLVIHTRGILCGAQEVTESDIQSILGTIEINTSL